MVKLIVGDKEVEVSVLLEDALNKAYELSLAEKRPVLLQTNKFLLRVEGPPYADNGRKVVYGWLRDHDREKLAELQEAGEKVFPEFNCWISKKGVRVQYEPDTKTDLLDSTQMVMYTGMLNMGFGKRWSERPKKEKK